MRSGEKLSKQKTDRQTDRQTDRHFAYNVTLRPVLVTTVAVEKQ